MRIASLLVALPSSAATALIYWLAGDNDVLASYELETGLLMSTIGWISAGLSYFVNSRTLAMTLIFSVQAVALYMVITFGSIRAAESVLFLATVAAAGVFVSRKALIISLLTSVVSLGAVTYAEMVGLLKPLALSVDGSTWFTHSAVLTAIASIVFYARITKRRVYTERVQALEENKRLAEERDRSLDRFARIFHNSPSPMLAQSGVDGSILDVNPAFERCYGYTREQVLGRSDTFLWAEPQQRSAYRKQLYKQKSVEQCAVAGLRMNGSRFDAQISSEISGDGNQADHLIITTVSDISAQTEALERLRRSEERFSKAFHFSPMHMSITRYADGKLIDVNKVAQSAQCDRFQGEPTIAREFWPSAERRADFVRTLRHHGRLHGYETQLCKPDGSLVEVRIWAELIDLEGEACVLACTMNVTEEKRRQALLENMARGMSAQAGESLFLALVKHMSHALAADTVYVAEIDAALHMRSLAVWSAGEQAANFTEHLDTLPLAPVSTDHAEQDLPATQDQQIRSDWPLLDDQGQVIGMLSAQWKQAVPLTPESQALMSIFASRANAELLRHRQEREVRHLNATLEDRVRVRTAELEQVNAELDAFAYSVSHDLKSPLRAIDGFAHLMLEQFEDRSTESERDAMKRILAATHRMSNLIKDLLALARISQSALKLSEVDLSDMALDILSTLQDSFPQARREIIVAPGLVGHCDPDLARIALTNLLHNALKYTRDQPHPVIELGQAPSAQGEVEFFVRDNGAGFDMAHADKLFKPFQRLHMPSAGFEGTGIGLATVRRIIERHGGSLRANAAVGKGACFTFTLPPPTASCSKGATRTARGAE